MNQHVTYHNFFLIFYLSYHTSNLRRKFLTKTVPGYGHLLERSPAGIPKPAVGRRDGAWRLAVTPPVRWSMYELQEERKHFLTKTIPGYGHLLERSPAGIPKPAVGRRDGTWRLAVTPPVQYHLLTTTYNMRRKFLTKTDPSYGHLLERSPAGIHKPAVCRRDGTWRLAVTSSVQDRLLTTTYNMRRKFLTKTTPGYGHLLERSPAGIPEPAVGRRDGTWRLAVTPPVQYRLLTASITPRTVLPVVGVRDVDYTRWTCDGVGLVLIDCNYILRRVGTKRIENNIARKTKFYTIAVKCNYRWLVVQLALHFFYIRHLKYTNDFYDLYNVIFNFLLHFNNLASFTASEIYIKEANFLQNFHFWVQTMDFNKICLSQCHRWVLKTLKDSSWLVSI